MKRVRLLQPAEREMLDAACYYQSQSKVLSVEFLEKVGSAFHDIAMNPERCPVICHEIRRRRVYRFPYAVLYRIESAEIIVVAVAHLRRRPEYWTER